MAATYNEQTYSADWLKYEQDTNYCRKTVKLVAGTDYPSGTVLGKVTASGLYTKCNTGAGDGSEAATGVLVYGVNANATAATGSTGTGNTQVDYVANELGTAGNNINIALIDPGANNATLSIAVTGDSQSGYTISISLATGAGGTVTTTSGDIPTLIAGDATAAALVTATDSGNDTDILAGATLILTGGTNSAVDNEGVMLNKNAIVTSGALTYTGTLSTIQTALEALGIKFGEQAA